MVRGAPLLKGCSIVETDPDILSLLIQHEYSLGTLYDFFAATPGTGEAPWHFLAYDERRHARALASLRSVPDALQWLGDASGFRRAAVQSSLDHVESQKVRAETLGVTAVQAIAIAVDLENVLIERLFSRAGASEPAAVRSVLESLARETEKHREALVRALEAARRNQAQASGAVA
jgi:hypothetical protein